jgi:DNA-binding response OmpR family regulator
MEALLTSHHFEALCCNDPSKALQILLAEHIDIVLCDWQMPKTTGLGLCQTISQSPAMSAPYFIMLTGRKERADMIAAMDAGADDFICKPAASEELRARIQAGLRRLHRERSMIACQEKLLHFGE